MNWASFINVERDEVNVTCGDIIFDKQFIAITIFSLVLGKIKLRPLAGSS
jgi:hypothetical protein